VQKVGSSLARVAAGGVVGAKFLARAWAVRTICFGFLLGDDERGIDHRFHRVDHSDRFYRRPCVVAYGGNRVLRERAEEL
jgi:hypothetical protein